MYFDRNYSPPYRSHARALIVIHEVKNYRFAILANEASIPFFVAQRSRLRNRDEGVAPTRGRILCGSDPQIAISKPSTLSNIKLYRVTLAKMVSTTYV